MTDSQNFIILVANVSGETGQLIDFNQPEVTHAVERCIRRVELTQSSFDGKLLQRGITRLCSGFVSADAAVMAAKEMLERILALPRTGGQWLGVSIGIHYGAINNIPNIPGPLAPGDKAIEQTVAIATACPIGNAYISKQVYGMLNPGIKKLLKPVQNAPDSLQDYQETLFFLNPDEPSQEATYISSTSTNTQPHRGQRLLVLHEDERIILDEQNPFIMIGRDPVNGIVIVNDRASRQHARIELRFEGFTLIDHSSNGCYLSNEATPEVRIKNKKALLGHSGYIGCGFSTHDTDAEVIFFETIPASTAT